MSFMDATFSKWGEVATAVLSQSLAKRFARVMLAAVLAASFLPVVAFADAPAISGPNQIKYYMTAQYTNRTSRSEYKWTWSSKDSGAIKISYLDNLYPDHRTVSITGTELGHVTLKVSGGDVAEEHFEIEITKRDITLTSSNLEEEYNGEEHKGGLVSIDGGDLVGTDELDVTWTKSLTDVGEVDNEFYVTFTSGTAANYNITYRYGKLKVTPRVVTLKSADLSKEYDGEPLTNGTAAIAIEGASFVKGQGVSYTFTGSQKIVGSYENAFECIPNEGTNLDNYQIKKKYGTLTVTDRSEKYQITLTPNSKSVTYDGTEKSVSGFEALEFEVDGSTYTVEGLTAEARGTDAGEYPVKVSGQAVVIDSDGNDVTDQFTVNIDDAKLTIIGVDSDKSASNLPHTGDSTALYAMGICGVAIAAGAGALFTSRKRNNYK
ncbi:LPXTG cell wall anchor domain-containing protein [Paratractidigestivibacter faecalis]|uniref:LPXTG cell wall anchor domain-containing protein n=1 Tax=Paratractidigestivibacter faecalis TaxID=2292441 RepID=UPI003F9BC7AD